jgi:hypothetical protein
MLIKVGEIPYETNSVSFSHLPTSAARFAKNTFGDTDTIITSFEQSFAKLKDDFLAGIDITTVITVLDTQQVVLDMQKTLGRIREPHLLLVMLGISDENYHFRGRLIPFSNPP